MFPHPACMRKPLTCLNTNRENYFLTLTFAKLLQKSEMRKDIVIELSYKGFG